MEMIVVVLICLNTSPRKIYQINLLNVNKVCNLAIAKLILKFKICNKQLATLIIQFISVKLTRPTSHHKIAPSIWI